MTDVVVASLATPTPMGQQEYEHQLVAGLSEGGLALRAVHVTSLRSTTPADRRIPLRLAASAPLPAQHAIARYAYGSSRLVHRADLRLPAASHEVVTVHDLAPLRFSDEGEIPRRAADTLRAARAVIAPSVFAAAELRDLFEIDAVVIPNGIDPAVWLAPQPAAFDMPSRFVLHSGGATDRKNLAALADAWTQLAADDATLELVLCGPPDERRTSLFVDRPRTRLLGRVDRATHLAVMKAALAVVVPSVYEGFGFPALEAMAMGTPVVAANRASLPEICGDAALLTEPDADSLARALHAALADDPLRARLAAAGPDRARRFTWEGSVRAHREVYERALG